MLFAYVVSLVFTAVSFETPIVTFDETMRKEIKDQAVRYRKTANHPLSDFQIRVNAAAVELRSSWSTQTTKKK